MRLLIFIAIGAIAYYIWTTVSGRASNPFHQKAKVAQLKEKILLLLRGNEEAFLRMYEREKGLYPDLSEWEILERIMYKLSNDR